MQSGIKDVDQAHLPQVQDVRREFAVLEDGALAHCLQEQEIEQYYASNIQKNRLVQKDIRVARKLQDEEAKQGKSTVVEQQKEIAERDSEYARAIQEEIRKQLEESKRREEEDKEIARRLQEEEEREQQRLQIQARRLGDGESPVRDREHGFHRSNLLHQHHLHHHQRRHRSSEEDRGHLSDYRDSARDSSEGTRLWSPDVNRQGRDNRGDSVYSNSQRGCYEEQGSMTQSHPGIQNAVQYQDKNHRTRESKRYPCGISDWPMSYAEETGRLSNRGESEFREGDHLYHQKKEVRRTKSCRTEYRPHDFRLDTRMDGGYSPGEAEIFERERSSRYYPSDPTRSHQFQHFHTRDDPSVSRRESFNLRQGSSGKSYNPDILEWRVGKLGLKDNSQLFEDEVLARRLQEEEERHLRTWSLQKQEEDFLAAQVAQDEEIAKYMQKRELKSRRWPREAEMSPRKAELSPKEVRSNPEETEPCPREARLKHRDAEYGWQQREDADGDSDSSERRRNSRSRKLSNEVPTTHQKRLDSGSLPSRTEDEHPGRSDSPTQTTTASGTDRTSYICPKNIAEELDPTFKAKDKERSGEAAPVTPPAATKSPSVPVDGFFDYMDESTEPVFIPPTKRQTDKAGHQKSREKKEGCKQQ
ncbi:trichohyalin-like isoform X2 [Protopterus annectens]|uniref:trichohyalin-like isoform X2 n=1 Tax=Protopterus annectens TaxID=7888 RepID=UPI001CFBCB97|nr:trichohyalin-like isoform X2 [Protopterus annectens]